MKKFAWDIAAIMPALKLLCTCLFFLSVSSAVFDSWQKRQTGKMGKRRDDMWQRLHARFAGTQYVPKSSETKRCHKTPWLTVLAAALLWIIEIILHITVHFIYYSHYDFSIFLWQNIGRHLKAVK